VEGEVAAVLLLVASVAHAVYLHNVNMASEVRRAVQLFDGLIPFSLHRGHDVSLPCSRLGSSCAALKRPLFHGGAGSRHA
jgi:hypothetical protein